MTAPTAERRSGTVVRPVRAYSASHLSSGELLQLAATIPELATHDPVDSALLASLETNAPELQPQIAQEFDPARPDRRYSLARSGDLVIMRGDLEAVLEKSQLSGKEKAALVRHARSHRRRGQRLLGVATAKAAGEAQEGTALKASDNFALQGFIALSLESRSKAERVAAHNQPQWVRVPLWPLSIRVLHWLNVFFIVTLSVSGYYIMNPAWLPAPPPVPDESGFTFGWVRLIHFVAATGWLTMGLSRVWLWFFSRHKQLRWRAMWPLDSKESFRGLWGTIRHYAFLDKEGPLYITHNPLQQLSYTGLYALCIIQMGTGLALFGLYNQYNGIWRMLAYPIHWIGVPEVRLIHTVLMYVIWAFVIIHIYLAVRADTLERHGGVSSMISGAVWLRRGAQPVDGPRVD
ncbi:Ni/Fe-hydrogenase, b-type cytochrome subunit [Corynebacterium poyangense]|uniref:Ni/Fe-hydrogenase, b-type cytochrome subunit n=1 Tax=Corynebacterium poyangense TaxID=2684405 RepID=A0A7H0SR58_9CORY|nr:Ni/Fe-hydrogenase, b-type cytochrome subunit [Corynebacterium poyangense]MBZ8176460.1 Ni/Fe-hydrogenase, b-type cytochrome subunit [Corynebacterium poyangense]QNQ91033.1 Ni/Fe-hydrogenase, b-type cytochrome subunit [Corynebacterium poyangense]